MKFGFWVVVFFGINFSIFAKDTPKKEILPISSLPFKPLPFRALLPNAEFYEFNQKTYVFDKIVGNMPLLTGNKWKAVGSDPIKFTLTPNKTTAQLGEEIELTLTAELMDVSPQLLFTFDELRNYTMKVVLPKDFILTGGTYYDFVTGTLDPANPKKQYTLKGRFLDKPTPDGGTPPDCFKVLRKLNNEVFILKNTTCINVTDIDLVSAVPAETVSAGRETLTGIDLSKVNLATFIENLSGNELIHFGNSSSTFNINCYNQSGFRLVFTLTNESTSELAIKGGSITWELVSDGSSSSFSSGYGSITLHLSAVSNSFICKINIYSSPNGTGTLLGSKTQTITINRNPCPTSTTNSLSITATETSLCPGNSSVLAASGTCPPANISWQKNGSNYGSAGVNTLNTIDAGAYKAVCSSPAMTSNTINIAVSTTPTVPNLTADKHAITPGEFVTLSATNCQGTVVWYGPNNFTDVGDQISTNKPGNYNALCRSNCNGTSYYSDLSGYVSISLLPLRLESDKYEIYSNETAQISAYGCTNGFITWKLNGGLLPNSNNPLTAYTSGTYQAQCTSFDGPSSDWVAIYIGTKATNTPRVTASKTKALPTDNVVLTASGCPAGWFYAWQIPVHDLATNAVNVQRLVGNPQTVKGPETYKVQCVLNANEGPFESITVTPQSIYDIVLTITPNKTEANPGEAIVFTATGNCPIGAGIRWFINGMDYWTWAGGDPFQATGPGTYSARCESGYQIGNMVYYTIKIPKPGAVSIITDKAQVKNNELVTLTAVGCDKEVVWTLPNKTEVRGSAVLFNYGSGVYKAACVRFGFTGPAASITIATRNPNDLSIIGTSGTLASNQMGELTIVGCPNGWVGWKIPVKDAAGNIVYQLSDNKTILIREPGIYYAACAIGDYTGWQTITVPATPPNSLYIKPSITSARPDESVILTAYGCPNGIVQWQNGTATTVGNRITVLGPGLRKAKCVGDYSNNGDWAMANIRSLGSITPLLVAKSTTTGAIITEACPSEPVTVLASGCPSGWWYQTQFVRPGMLDYWLTHRWEIDLGNGYLDVFGFAGNVVNTTGPNIYFARCISPDGSWMGDFRDKYVVIEPAFPADLRVSNSGPALTGATSVSLAVTEVPNVSYAWSGPNAFANTNRSPLISTPTDANAGIYTVTLKRGTGQPWACSTTATTKVAISGCDNVKITAIDPSTGEELNTLRRDLFSNQFQPIALSVSGMGSVSLQYSWAGPDNNGVTTPHIITNKAGVYSVYATPLGSTVSCKASTNIFEPKLYDIAWNKQRQGSFANGQTFEYYPVSVYNVNIKYFVGNIEVQKDGYEVGLIKYLSGTTPITEFLHIIPTKEGIADNNSNFEGIILQTDFLTNNIKKVWKYVNGVAVGSYSVSTAPQAREINEICKVVIQVWDTKEGATCYKKNGCGYYVGEHAVLVRDWIRYVNCDSDGTGTSNAPTSYGGGGTIVPLTNFAQIMCRNSSYLVDSKIMDLVLNSDGSNPCKYDKKYKLLLKLIEYGMRDELKKLDLEDGIDDAYVSHTVTNLFENILKPSKTIKSDGTSFWNFFEMGCSITQLYTELIFKYPADREKLEEAMLKLAPKVNTAYLALAPFLQDCDTCPAGMNLRPNSVSCCNGDLLDEVWNAMISRGVNPIETFDVGGDDSFMKEEDVPKLWNGLSSGKTIYPTGNPDNTDEVKINLLGRTVKYSPNINGKIPYLSFVTCDGGSVIDFNKCYYDFVAPEGILEFSEDHIIAADNIVKKFFDKYHNVKPLANEINSEALQFAVSQKDGLFKNGTVGDINNFIALCFEIWMNHFYASFLSVSLYDSHINRIATANTNIEKASQILIRGKEVEEKVGFFALVMETMDEFIILAAGQQRGIITKIKPRIGKIKINSNVQNKVDTESINFVNAKTARNSAGVVSGNGNTVDASNWLKGTSKNVGLFPIQIANKLRGKTFSSFTAFRKAIWKEVGNDPNLAKNFSIDDQINMKNNGLAPIAPDGQNLGKNTKYILHHKTPIQHGGNVYDVDNLIFTTPRYHKEILDPKFHF